MDYQPIEEPFCNLDEHDADAFQIVDAAGMLSPSMSKERITNLAFAIKTDPVVIEEQDYDPDNGGGYSVLGVLRWMNDDMLAALRKRVLAREATRTHHFQIV